MFYSLAVLQNDYNIFTLTHFSFLYLLIHALCIWMSLWYSSVDHTVVLASESAHCQCIDIPPSATVPELTLVNMPRKFTFQELSVAKRQTTKTEFSGRNAKWNLDATIIELSNKRGAQSPLQPHVSSMLFVWSQYLPTLLLITSQRCLKHGVQIPYNLIKFNYIMWLSKLCLFSHGNVQLYCTL